MVKSKMPENISHSEMGCIRVHILVWDLYMGYGLVPAIFSVHISDVYP